MSTYNQADVLEVIGDRLLDIQFVGWYVNKVEDGVVSFFEENDAHILDVKYAELMGDA